MDWHTDTTYSSGKPYIAVGPRVDHDRAVNNESLWRNPKILYLAIDWNTQYINLTIVERSLSLFSVMEEDAVLWPALIQGHYNWALYSNLAQ